MQTPPLATGVSIQYPIDHTAAGSTSERHETQPEFPFAFPASSLPLSDPPCRSDTIAYTACQELAYHFAYENARRSVQALLLQTNDTSFCQVLRFFVKYCATNELAVAATGSTLLSASRADSTAVSASRRRLWDPNAPVLFPSFHAFPTAAVITGTDATSSELWVEPLLQKLRRTFPLCVVVPRDVTSARRLIEWLAAKLAKLCAAKQREHQWVQVEVEAFDLLSVDALSVPADITSRPLTRQERAKSSGSAVETVQVDEKDYVRDDSCSEASFASEGSGDEVKAGMFMKKKRKRRRASVAYGRWTMTKLLTTIRRDIQELVSLAADSSASGERIAMLDEMVRDRLEESLARVEEVQGQEENGVFERIACYDEAVAWLQHRIRACRKIAAKLLNVAHDTNDPVTGHVGATEMALALMLQRVYCRYMTYMKACTMDRAGMNDRRRSLKQEMSNHENYYHLRRDAKTQNLASRPIPISRQSFLLLCIEQLEAFSQQVFGDFLEIWTHFVRQQEEKDHMNAASSTLGFVIGVTSATAPALRRLDLSVTNRLELQFFSLIDSRKCFNDILEALVVKAKLPLSLGGNIVRAIASRYRRLPSVPRLLLALRYLLFTHFRRCPWSFLALAIDGLPSSGESPILLAADVAPLPYRVLSWITHHRRHFMREAQGRAIGSDSALTSWLVSCSALELKDLESRVMPSLSSATTTDNEWLSDLEAAMLRERRRRARWRLGWECFRSACSWLDVRVDGSKDAKHGEEGGLAVTHLILALEGRLGEGPRYMEVLRRMQSCRWALLSGMIEDWHASYRVFGLHDDEGEDLEGTLRELAMLCAYARAEKTPAKMLAALRRELVTAFTCRLLSALLRPSAPDRASRADALVASWSKLTDANVLEERLRFEYHDNLRNVLQEAGIGKDSGSRFGANTQSSWVHDVGLAFLFYQESASASLSLSEWYESFALELREEADAARESKGKAIERKKVDDTAMTARFVRAICTLRHWGFLRSDAPRDQEQDIVEKLVFI
ncbi:unnamed protein product [Hyaloperonospora brassicae]|uniref:Origin recognition complex subunit 3 N-terminal domain-containing protein n=1 Tax=Hyaloperonospora brassicae TaxID=162125 RepID=A0AAV0TKR6_HYABA|nr:unnamed protein product [Hyaloperonospora brassicae]